MVISSKYTIDIPEVHLLSYLFDKSLPHTNTPLFIDADNSSQRTTKAELEVLVRKIGYGLRDVVDLNVGDTVFVCAANSILFPSLFLGILCAGGIFTGTNPAYTTQELVHQMRLSKTQVIFTDTESCSKILKAAEILGIEHSRIFLINNDENLHLGNGIRRLDELLHNGELQWDTLDHVDKVSERIAVLNFSSGTTGPPKACMITHHNLIANTQQIYHLDSLARSRNKNQNKAGKGVYCAYVPLYHAMGMLQFCILNVKRDCTSVILSKFGLEPVLSAIEKFKVTELLTPPPVAVMIIKSPLVSKYDLSSVVRLLCGAAPLGRDTSIQLQNIFKKGNATVAQAYGMTEATCSITMFAPDEYDPTHTGVGYLCANMQAKILDDEGKEVELGQVGEAVIRGPNLFKGYWDNLQATKDTWTEDGWLKTGDYVLVKPDGIFSIVDRKKELIKVKGFQVAPSELEEHLLEYDLVKDCAVIRVIRNGEECPQAHIVAHGSTVTAELINAFIKSRVAPYKRLTGGVVFTDLIPKSPSGKIMRRLIKDPFAKTNIDQPKL